MINYPEIWRATCNLPWCALVTTGRPGTDFFQSLLDEHSDIFVFNGSHYSIHFGRGLCLSGFAPHSGNFFWKRHIRKFLLLDDSVVNAKFNG